MNRDVSRLKEITSMRTLLLTVLVLVSLCQVACAGNDNPKSQKTHWRIPANAAVTAVGVDLNWELIEHKDGRLTLTAGLAEHHSYEQVWAYYAHRFGMTTNYGAGTKHQKHTIDTDVRTITEHDRDQVFKAGRWSIMRGNFGRYKTQVDLYDDNSLTEEHRVLVRIHFTPR